MAITPIDFPANPIDGQTHVENNETYVYQAAQDFWLGGQAGQVYLLNKANVGFLQKFYLGAFDTINVPSTMPDGSPLIDYVMYFNTTTATMMMWHGGTVNAWKAIIKPVPADSKVYTYKADGVSKSFTGADVNGLTPVLDSTNPEKIVIWNGAYLTESTVANPADFSVDYVTSTFNLTRVPRAGTTVNIHVLTADSSNLGKDPVVFHVASTTAAKAFAGTLPDDKLRTAIAPVVPQLGTVVIVSHDPVVGADNSYEGVWYYSGRFTNIFQGGSGGGGSRIFQTTATILEARKGLFTQATDILDGSFTSIFSTASQDGDWVVVPLVQGNLAKYSGLYVKDPVSHSFIPAATSYSTNYIEGYVRTTASQLSDIDIATKGIPTGSIQVITDTNKRELLVASSTGTWISMYSEVQVHKWAAEASLWQSALAKAQLPTLPTPAIENKGQYWTWIGEPDPSDPTLSVGGQIVDATYPKIGTDLAGEKLQIGDWIQSDGTKWIHVPADLLNKSRWLALGSFKEYVAGSSNEKGTLVRIKLKWDFDTNAYIASAAGKYKYFQAARDLAVTDPAPPAAGWDDITPIVSPNKLENVVDKAVLEDKDILIYNDAIKQFELKPLPSSAIVDWDPAATYVNVGTSIIRTQLGAGDTNWTAGSYPQMYRSKSNVATNIAKDPLDPVLGPLFWEKIVRVKVADLEDVAVTNIADKQGIFWNAAQNTYENKFINSLFQWVDRPYTVQEVVFNKGHWYTPNKPISLGDAEPALTNADWNLVKGISTIDGLDNVNITTPTTAQILAYNSTVAEWRNKDIGSLFLWSDKDWARDTLVYDKNTNFLWVSIGTVVTGDAGPNLSMLGDSGYKWMPISADYVPSIWTGVVDEVSNTFVIRRPNGGTDTYTGPARLFLCLTSGATDPTVDAINYLEIGHKPMSTDDLTDVDTSTIAPTDGQILQYDVATSNFLPVDLPPPPNSWEPYNAGKAYTRFSYVSDGGFPYIAVTGIPAGLSPTAILASVTITTKVASTALSLANIEAFADTNNTSALTVGDYYPYDLGGTVVAPYTAQAGTLAGITFTEVKGFLMLVNKAPNTNLGFKGWVTIRDSQGTLPANIANTPQATITAQPYGVPNNPWLRLGVKTLNDLVEVDTATTPPTDNQTLKFDATAGLWKPTDLAAALGDLTDVDTTTTPPTDGDKLTWSVANAAWIAKSAASSGGLTVYSPTKAYPASSYVEANNAIYTTKVAVPANVAPDSKIASITVTRGNQASQATLANNGSAGKSNAESFNKTSTISTTVGQFLKFDGGAPNGGFPYTIPTGEAAGLIITEQFGWIMIVDKADPTIYGKGGYHFIPASAGSDPANPSAPSNQPPANIKVFADGFTTNPWQLLGQAPAKISDIGNVVMSLTPAAGDILMNDGTGNWAEVVNPSYTKAEVDALVNTLISGIAHGAAVASYKSIPPVSPTQDVFYIVKPTGTGAWAGQDNQIAYWDGTQWQFIAPEANSTHLVEDTEDTWHWNSTAWVKTANSGGGGSALGDRWMVGDIRESALTETQFKALLTKADEDKWALADGRNVAGTQYATVTGRNNIPDLRGAYLRMAGQNATNTAWNGGALGAWQEDKTARPTTPFTTDQQGDHYHSLGWYDQEPQDIVQQYHNHTGANPSPQVAHMFKIEDPGQGGGGAEGQAIEKEMAVSTDGNHSHTMNGGGDTETRPKTYTVNYFIRID